MRKPIWKIVACTVFASAVLVALGATAFWRQPGRQPLPANASAAGDRVGFGIGKAAPDFALPSREGETIRLSEYRGYPVLLNFWATWCAPCKVEMPWLVEMDQRWRAKGLRIIGVNLDDAGTNRTTIAAFARERGASYSILFGNQAVADAYGGVRFMPESFFIDANGKIVDVMYGITTRTELEQKTSPLLSRATSGR